MMFYIKARRTMEPISRSISRDIGTNSGEEQVIKSKESKKKEGMENSVHMSRKGQKITEPAEKVATYTPFLNKQAQSKEVKKALKKQEKADKALAKEKEKINKKIQKEQAKAQKSSHVSKAEPMSKEPPIENMKKYCQGIEFKKLRGEMISKDFQGMILDKKEQGDVALLCLVEGDPNSEISRRVELGNFMILNFNNIDFKGVNVQTRINIINLDTGESSKAQPMTSLLAKLLENGTQVSKA
jgi:hypothetical protein